MVSMSIYTTVFFFFALTIKLAKQAAKQVYFLAVWKHYPQGKERSVFMTRENYKDLVEEKSRPSNLGKNMLCAFFIGGTICTIGQGFRSFYGQFLDKDTTGVAVSITLIFIAAVLTGLGKFDDIARIAGAGTLVPITGFANAMVSPAIEFKQEGMVTGTAAKLFVVAGPVLVFGISASVLYGLLLVLLGL